MIEETILKFLIVLMLLGGMVYSFKIASHVQAALIRIKAVWIIFMATSGWLAASLALPLLRECILHALTAFVGAVLLLIIVERRGIRKPWGKAAT